MSSASASESPARAAPLPKLEAVTLPPELGEYRPSREELLARLHAKTGAKSRQRQRQRQAPSVASSVAEAAERVGSAALAPQAHQALLTTPAPALADMIKRAASSDQIPPHLRTLIPAEARNLPRKQLVKIIERLQGK